MTVDTECLTKSGFKRYDAVAPGDLVYTFNTKTFFGEWKPVTKIHLVFDYDDVMIEWNGDRISACVTPEHQWYVSSREFIQTKDIVSSHRIPVAEYASAVPGHVRFVRLFKLVGYNRKTVHHKGIVWCPHTENRTLFVRRNSRIFITGQVG